MLISYIILTYILLTLGLGFYWFFVRNRFSSSRQRLVLLSILGLSSLLPLLFCVIDSSSPTIVAVEPEVHSPETYFIEQNVLIDFCPTGELLEACYQEAITVEQFCNCDEIEKSNLLYYKSNTWYNWLSWQEWTLGKGLLIVSLGVLLFLSLNILYLCSLVSRSRKENIEIDEQTFVLLYPPKPLSVASFRLWNRYIIWQKEMEQLSVMEREAIYRHEIAHINQLDTWVKISINLLQILWVLHPGFYLVRQEIERLHEYFADERALLYWGDSKAYASMLLKMKTIGKSLNVAQNLKQNNSLFKQRIKHILSISNGSTSIAKRPHWFYMGAFFILTLMLSGVSTFSFPVIDKEVDKLKIYQTLSSYNQESGRTTFCRVCMQKELEEACH